MATKHVQFADESQEQIVSVFGCEQDPEVFANLGEVEEDDPRLVAFMAPLNFDPFKAQ